MSALLIWFLLGLLIGGGVTFVCLFWWALDATGPLDDKETDHDD
jgi:hypothetical protein